MHGKGTVTMTASAKFLTAYAESLQVGQQRGTAKQDAKGKKKVVEGRLGLKDRGRC
jgi:hypothetical protein